MADNLNFPILFDLEKGVDIAIKNWNDKYADRLEKAIQKRALGVKLKFDTKAFDNLDDVKRRLAELKITPLTPENKTAIRDLVRELKELARIMEKIQKFKGIELPELQMAKAAKLRKDVAQADEKLRLSKERVRQAEERLILSQQRAAQQANRTSRAFSDQGGYLERLIKKMTIYASFSMVGNFLTSVREVTAQFELQRVSLGAILQDANKGEQIFLQIKQFALNSPLSILDMTRYTKQLAAYKIEYDELFEMTKRFADISVGLGVDYQRIVLAAGQTRTATYLRASELKQFTELGVPLLEELSIKLSKMNGEMVSTAEVMDMISKRAISWELVKEVLYDMTDAGGMFYNMQIQQGNTLYGLWQKLGDAASVMYDQIGNTESVNSGMKTAIGLLTELMRNWKAVAQTAQWVIIPNAALMALYKYSTATQRVEAAQAALSAATQRRKAAVLQLSTAIRKGTVDDINAANATLQKAKADVVAAQKATTRWGLLKSGFVSVAKSIGAGLGIGLAIGAITAFSYKLFAAYENATRLNKELKKIKDETGVEQSRAVINFESLAQAAVNAAAGSKEQRNALEELKRTYGNVIPEQDLTIERLKEMKGNYDALTESIKENIRQQQLQKAIDTVTTETENKIIEEERKLRGRLKSTKFKTSNGDEFYLMDNQIDRIVSNFKRLVSAGENASAALQHAFELEQLNDIQYTFDGLAQILGLIEEKTGTTGVYTENMNAQIAQSDIAASGLTAALLKQNFELEKAKKTMGGFNAELGVLGDYLDEAKKKVDEHTFTAKANTFAYDEEKMQVTVEAYMKALQDAFDRANVKIDLNKYIQLTKEGDYLVDWQGLDEALAKLNSKWKVPLQGVAKEVKGIYESFVPADPVVKALKDKALEIATNTKLGKDKMRKHLWDGKVALVDHVKALHEAAEAAKAEIHRYNVYISQFGDVGKKIMEFFGFKIDEKTKEFNAITALLNEEKKYLTASEKESVFGKSKKKGSKGTKSDPRLQNLKEEISLVQKLYNEYKQLEKQEGATKAAADMRRMAGGTLDMFKSKYNIDLPTDAKDLTSALEILYKKMAVLPKKVFPSLDKDLKELRWTIEEVDIDESQKKIEAELKRLADRISRTKTAKEFYEKILSQTGDVELAANLSLSIYGENGEDLDKAIRDNIQATLGKNKQGIDLDFSAAIRADGSVDYNTLTKIAKGYLDMGEISEDSYNKILKMRDEDRKDLAKTVEGWLKATEKAKTYSDKLLDLRRKTQTEIDSINEKERRGDITPEFAESQRAGFLRKEAEEVAKLQYEAFKDSPMYVQMFDDLDNASTTMLRNMKQRIEELKTSWKDLTPTQLKEMQSRLNEIDAQLAKRNPFKGLIDGIKEYRKLRKGGDTLGNKSEGAAEKALDAAAKARLEAEKEYLEILNKEGATQEEIADAKKRFDDAAADEDAAAKALENWKKVKDAIGLSANELFQMLNWAGDIAKGIADISEAMGADEEDVQYWNDVADALGQISGGIQDIVSAAMSGNVVGVISSTLTAIPKMFVGFTNLFSAGKVKKANKEIKRQAELLEQLEYTYSRLEKAADKAFGTDYVNNYNQQIKNLQAQQQAYLKQAEAERSKGKKADEEKIKEYEEQARETADAIKDLQDDLVAHFTGSSRADVARQMAQSWIEARASMSDTFAAIKEDYSEMIKNMIVEGAAARVIENALTPMWDSMEKMLAKNDVGGAIDSLVNGMDDALTQANNGMEVLWKALEARGYDMKQLIGDVDSEYTGIAKNIAGATSEEINTVAAIGNTVMYHTSHLPIISQNVAAMYELMSQGKSSALPDSGTTGWTDWQQQAMDNYNAIARNTADTVVECRRAAVACEAATEKLNRAFRAKGATSGFNVFLNS